MRNPYVEEVVWYVDDTKRRKQDEVWFYKIKINDINDKSLSYITETSGLYMFVQKLYENNSHDTENPKPYLQDTDNKNVVLNIGMGGWNRLQRINRRIEFLRINDLETYTNDTYILLTKGFDSPLLRELKKQKYKGFKRFEKDTEGYNVICNAEIELKETFYPLYEKQHEELIYPVYPTHPNHVCFISDGTVRKSFGSKYYSRDNIERVGDYYVMRTIKDKG